MDPTCSNPRILASCFSSLRPRVIVLGHTHIRTRNERGNLWVVNPGSAWQSRSSEPPSVTLMTWDSDTDAFSFEDIFLD
jgi:predicted phosphodiesterase